MKKLTSILEGESAVIEKVDRNYNMNNILGELGLIRGKTIRVLRNNFFGIILGIDQDVRYAIRHETANGIYVYK